MSSGAARGQPSCGRICAVIGSRIEGNCCARGCPANGVNDYLEDWQKTGREADTSTDYDSGRGMFGSNALLTYTTPRRAERDTYRIEVNAAEVSDTGGYWLTVSEVTK